MLLLIFICAVKKSIKFVELLNSNYCYLHVILRCDHFMPSWTTKRLNLFLESLVSKSGTPHLGALRIIRVFSSINPVWGMPPNSCSLRIALFNCSSDRKLPVSMSFYRNIIGFVIIFCFIIFLMHTDEKSFEDFLKSSIKYPNCFK